MIIRGPVSGKIPVLCPLFVVIGFFHRLLLALSATVRLFQKAAALVGDANRAAFSPAISA
jgi:hypothetical protein